MFSTQMTRILQIYTDFSNESSVQIRNICVIRVLKEKKRFMGETE